MHSDGTAAARGQGASTGADKLNGMLGCTGKEMLGALRNVVMNGPTGQSNGMQNAGQSTVRLTMTHSNLVATFPEIVIDRHTTVENLKDKCRLHSGTSVIDMVLVLQDHGGRNIAQLDDDSKMIGYYSPLDGWIVHITDTNPYSLSANGGLEDVSQVKKYEMSDDDYMKLDDNYRKWKAKKLEEDPTWTLEKEQMRKKDPNWEPPEKISDPDYMKDLCETEGVVVGARCEVAGGRRGAIRYIGKTVLGEGWWMGVQYDEPVGKNDGTVKGEKYFECDDKYGGMVRPNLVVVGDFPEKDLFSDSSDEEI